MAANAPYYQMRSGQFVTTPRGTNTTPSHYDSEDDGYDHSAIDVAATREHRTVPALAHTHRQISTERFVNTPEDNHNLAELLEAATTAADQAAQAMEARDASAAQDADIRKRLSSPFADTRNKSPGNDVTNVKRRRIDVPMDPNLPRTTRGSRGSSESTSVPPTSDSLLNDARAAGVHSAAALFRRPSDRPTTRKYTRPPMSKLFMSLQLSPENFLQLQALAKTYMLDPAHPERQNCVGNRGKGDTDMVKLRLFNCVRDFLEGGSGEQFFGENVEKPGDQDVSEAARALGENQVTSSGERLTWPRDGNKIISLVTPLMRRMVTNERQRIYAIETRKGGTQKKDKEGSVEPVPQRASQSPSGHITPRGSVEPHFAPVSDTSPAGLSSTSQRATPTVAMSASSGLVDRTVHDRNVDATNLPVRLPFPHAWGSILTLSQLPSHSSEAPRLTNINMFLTLAPHITSNGDTNPGIKLDQKRIVSEQADQLIAYPWDTLLRKVKKLLTRAKAKYPAVRNASPILTASNPTNNLRELAAAANAMQNDTIMASTETSPSRVDDSAPTAALPRYAIKTVGTEGWDTIGNAQQWSDLLLRRSRDVWADGVVNLVVELIDVHVGADDALAKADGH
jgi:hypothetical protein